MIYPDEPSDWKDLQERVATIFREIGFDVVEEKTVELARGQAEIDVYAQDSNSIPESIYVVECKHWKKLIPQTVVHSFRTVVADSGAHHGLLVSRVGFQSGASAASHYTNIKLLNWLEFEQLFGGRWFRDYAGPKVRKECDPLVQYTEPMNATVTRALRSLDEPARKEYLNLKGRYANLGELIVYFSPFAQGSWGEFPDAEFLRSVLLGALPTDSSHFKNLDVPGPLSMRTFMDVVIDESTKATKRFDKVFGKRVVS